VIWPDRRSAAQVAEIEALIGRRRMIGLAGSRPATGFQATSIRWLQKHQPALWRRARRVLLPKDYVRYCLAAGCVTDASDASGTLLFDVGRRAWSKEILSSLAIEPSRMPVVTTSTHIAGRLAPSAAHDLNLPRGIPVVTGAADTAASALGAGVTSPSELLITIGTGAQVLVPALDARTDPDGRVHTLCSAIGPANDAPGWYQMAGILSGGLALRWLRDQVLGLRGDGAYDEMTSWAAGTPAGARGLLFLPYLLGERSPHMDPHASGLWLGLTTDHGRGELVRSVLEGVAFAIRDAHQVLVKLGASPARAVVAGGGARSGLWRQIVADVCGIPTVHLQGADQSAAGAAMLAGAGVGLFDAPSAARDWARRGDPLTPHAGRHAMYERLYDVYKAVYIAHRDDFRTLRGLAEEWAA
jgi:xylulokinase